ncbi:MAG: carboxypeptidase regulatory-like domain-containing protein [Acidobacteria bacterium]|nr:carboxypeptidase regulatory-like domain-containing protein [Acidobacteriota bacterium]
MNQRAGTESRILYCLLAGALLGGGVAAAQQVSGSIVGTVTDNTGAVVPGAAVTLIHQETGAIRSVQSDAQGDFSFNAVPPGAYSLTVEHAGFKKYEKKNINLPPNERLPVGPVQLAVGELSETISVTAEGSPVQTASSERSGLVTSNQMESLAVVNRSFTALISLLPGVVTSAQTEVLGWGGNMTFNVQGGRQTTSNFTLDGLPIVDLGAATGSVDFLSMDSVREVKILVSNFQAEFGRKPGASIQAVTKSGSKDFHGAAYWYQRHEKFNANNFFNNRGGLAAPRYRYTTAGVNLGGPIFIPGKFNSARNKLFFFFSEEQLREQRPQAIRQLTMPAEAERAGNFSDSRELNGALIVVKDPASGQPFPSNLVPASRVNRLGQGYLKLLPAPNFFDTQISARRYNYQFQESLTAPKHNELVRIDYPVNSKLLLYGRFNHWWEETRGAAAPAGSSNWGWLSSSYQNTSKTVVLSSTVLLGPTTILEASFGYLRSAEFGSLKQEDVNRVSRAKTGLGFPQFQPETNPLGLLPQASFGGISNSPSITYDGRFPINGVDQLYTWNAALTKTVGGHTLKFGAWIERANDNKGPDSNFAGNFDLGRNVNNPNDSNHPYANALLGNFNSYTESSARPVVQGVSTVAEWFAQDNWKARRNLTVDIGVRLSRSQPYHSPRGEEAGFVASRWNPSKVVKLVEPFISGGKRVARDPATGAILPVVMIGAISTGAGDPFNGSVSLISDTSYPRGLRNNSGLKAAPRLGLSWDPFGKGKTAIRVGAGLFYEAREMGPRQFGMWKNPPVRLDPVIYYQTIDNLIGSTGVMFPSATGGYDPNWPVARTINASFGIQQQVGFATVIDVAYSGAFGRHLLEGRNLNSIPFGANFNPANGDPTTPGKPLPAAFLRPYLGYNDIIVYDYGSNSSYHSLQVTANRRFARQLQFTSAWTWSKAMDYADTNTGTISTLINPKVWNYGKAGFDRTHVVKLSWTWNLPKPGQRLRNRVAGVVLDNWQVSGIATFQSGSPSGVALGFVNSTDTTGSPTDGARVVVIANPVIPKSERTFSRNFNTDAFAAPAVGTFGNAAKDLIRGPGLNDWDISLFKAIPLGTERAKAQLRGEFYNAFNHTQFTGLDTNTRFDAQGKQANARFSEFTGAAAARRIQLALRLSF